MGIRTKITLLAFAITAIPLASAQTATGTQPGTPSGQAYPEVVMSLERCLEIALTDNPTVKVADMEIKRLDFSRKEVIGQLLPNISFSGMYNRALAKQVAYMNMDGFKMPGLGGSTGDDTTEGDGDGTGTPQQIKSRAGGSSGSGKRDDGIKMGLDNSYQLGFSASLPLIAPQLWKSLKLSDSQILESIEQARSSRQSLVNQVKNAYYGLLLAEDSYKVIEQNMEMARFTADLYQRQFEAGTASQYDVLRTQVAMRNIEPELTQAQITIRQARLQLLLLMGISDYFELKPDVALADYEKTMYDRTMAMSRDISRNSDLRLLDIRTEMLSRTLTVQRMAWFPTLALTANYSWTSSSNGSPFKNFRWNPYSMVGLSLSLPIFEGGQRYSRIKQAKIQVDEMQWQRDNLVNSINMQVDLAFENIQLNVKQIDSCSESVRQATAAHDIVKRSFEIGAASYLDLRDAELALTRSRLAYNQSIYNFLVASSNLEQLVGAYDVTPYMPAR